MIMAVYILTVPLIGYVGYQLCAQGMSKDQAFGLWMGMLRLYDSKILLPGGTGRL
ncbi:MAG: hypothetical protein ACLTER_16715 [Ruminococcus sp.]